MKRKSYVVILLCFAICLLFCFACQHAPDDGDIGGGIGQNVDGDADNTGDIGGGIGQNVDGDVDNTDESTGKTDETAKYTVTFDSNGAVDVPAVEKIAKGSRINLPTSYTKDGFIFGGWFKEKECINEWILDEDEVNSDITLYAKWCDQLIINSALGGYAFVESCEKTYEYWNEYKVVAEPDEGFWIKKWIVKMTRLRDGDERIYEVENNVFRTLVRNGTYVDAEHCAVTPVFTNDQNEIIKVNMHINIPEGGTVVYPEYGVKDSAFEVSIVATPGYYIQSYGYSASEEYYPDMVHYVFYPLMKPSEFSYVVSGSANHINWVFSFWCSPSFSFKGEDKEFFVNFIKQSDAVVVLAQVKNGYDGYHGQANAQGSIRTGNITVNHCNTYYSASAYANKGYVFSHWEDEEGNIVGYDERFQYYIAEHKDRTFYAVFKNAAL